MVWANAGPDAVRVEPVALEALVVAGGLEVLEVDDEVEVELVELLVGVLVAGGGGVCVLATDTVLVPPEPQAHSSPAHSAAARLQLIRRRVITLAQDIRRRPSTSLHKLLVAAKLRIVSGH